MDRGESRHGVSRCPAARAGPSVRSALRLPCRTAIGHIAYAMIRRTAASILMLLVPIALRAQDDLGKQVLGVFQQHCAECHGSKADPKKKSFRRLSSVDDLAKLKANLALDGQPYKKKVVDASSPNDSELLQHTVGPDADMPQDDQGNYKPLADAEQKIVRAWFAADMPLPGVTKSATPQPERVRPPFVDEEVWIQAILKDLQGLSDGDRKQARYFTMGHLYNGGIGEVGLAAQRRGLAKLLYSLSWAPTTKPLVQLGTGNAIVRIFLRDLDWDAAKWDRILAVKNNYFVRQGLDEEKEIERLTGTLVAYVRSDWFVFHAAQPPLYHELLAPRGDPHALDSDHALEAYLKVDVAKNIADFQVVRAGFYGGKVAGGSGVSDNNRLLERHTLAGWQGAYWKSYDFGGNAAEKSLFERPFGPLSLSHWPEETRKRSFVQDGGELIWNLPNGFQAYLLVDDKGKRIDLGPVQIVKDRAESGGLGTTIVNGISCMACHNQGMKRQADKIREHVESLTPTTFTRGERQLVQKLHPKIEQMQAVFDGDEQRYAKAARAMGVYDLDGKQREPVVAVFQGFRDETVKFDQAAFELGLSPQQLQGQLGGALASLRRQLETQGVPRDQFLDSFRTVAKALRIELVSERGGEQRAVPKANVDVLRQGSKLSTGIGLTMLYVEPQSFQMGSPQGETGRDADETLHGVKITKGYWLGETEVTQKQWVSVMKTRPWQNRTYAIEGDEVAASYVSWNDAVEFCRKLTELERSAGRLPAGHSYQLPSEAEWELACRAGTKTRYSFGDAEGQLKTFAVFGGSRSGDYAHPVKSCQANGWGFYDLHGNVWEWCADEVDYGSGVVSAVYREGAVDPLNKGGPRRASRGGGLGGSAASCRSAGRNAREPGFANADLGFRPALVARSDK